MTVYAPSDYNHHWYQLQKKFIERNTTVPYDFKIITNNVDAKMFESDEVVITNSENIGHPEGLRQAIQFMKQSKGYSGYLLLDSDCFPVRVGWQDILDRQMAIQTKSIVAPIRFENLDLFPHPCVVYLNQPGLENPDLNFDYKKVKNLLGDEINEVGGGMVNLMSEVMPLLRTNRINLHPVAAGIYHHLFYHHGAGSRGFQFRVLKEYNYYEHWFDESIDHTFGDKLMEALVSDPNYFIDKLMYGY